MSPEPMLCAPDVDAGADSWGLGFALCEPCTATVPFPGKTVTAVCARFATTAQLEAAIAPSETAPSGAPTLPLRRESRRAAGG